MSVSAFGSDDILKQLTRMRVERGWADSNAMELLLIEWLRGESNETRLAASNRRHFTNLEPYALSSRHLSGFNNTVEFYCSAVIL